MSLIGDFFDLAFENLRLAEACLAKHPEIASEADLYTALLLGDVERVRSALEKDGQLAIAAGGPHSCEPLVYACFSRFAAGGSARADAFVSMARLLLEHGADPNTGYRDKRWPQNPLPCLYAATGLNNNAPLGLLLLKAGAKPNDSESLYHSTEHPDLTCLKMLLENGAVPAGSNALKHMLDYESVEGVQRLLAAGADPNEVNAGAETALHWAVWRGRSATVVKLLLDGGANAEARRHDGRTAYALAIVSGQTETAVLLKERGANTQVSETDALVGACAVAESEEMARLAAAAAAKLPLPAEYSKMLPEFASSHWTNAVRALLALGVPIESRDNMGGTALHWACWKGYADLAEFLLSKGAPLTLEDATYHATPAGWFSHGVRNSGMQNRAYPEVARLLLAARAKFTASDLPTGDGDVDAVFRRNGLL